jgi:hypothetical protein
MKNVLVCGSRTWGDCWPIQVLLAGLKDDIARNGEAICILHGDARGADAEADVWARYNGFRVIRYPAKWDEHGKAAGPIRNQEMLDHGFPEHVIAFCDDLENSKGTADMVRRAKKAGIPTYVVSHA